MNRRLLRFELRYHGRQRSTWAVGIAFLLLGLAFSQLTLGGDGVRVGAPYSVALNLGLLSLMSVFPVSVVVARTMLREEECGTRDLIRSTPLGGHTLRVHVLLGLVVTILAAASTAIVPMVVLPAVLGGEATAGPAALVSGHAIGLALILGPNVLVLVALQSLVARTTRSMAAVHLGAVGIFLGYLGLSMWFGSPLIAGSPGAGGSAAGTLLDPFGLIGLLDQARGWTVVELNTRMVGLDGGMLANRALWLTLAGIALARVLRDRAPRRRSPVHRGGEPAPGPASGNEPPDLLSAPQVTTGWRHHVASVLSGSRMQISSRLTGVPLVSVAVAWVALAALGLMESIGDGTPFFDTPYRPLTELVVPALFRPFRLVGSLIMIVVASHLTWSDRTSGMHHLSDPTPVPNGVRYSSVVVSLAAVAFLLVALLVATASGYQIVHGGRPDGSLHAGLFYLLGVPWLLVGILTVGVQVLSKNRHVGMLVAGLLLVFWRPFSLHVLDLDLPLVFFGWVPEPDYSVFAGFEPFLGAVHGYTVHGALLCVLVSALSVALWRRGLDGDLGSRAAQAGAPGPGATIRWAGAGGVGLLVTGALLFVARADQGWVVDEGYAELWRADYEKRFSHLAGLPHPSVEKMELTFDAYPEERRYEVTGRYRIRNDTGEPVDSIFVGWDRDVTSRRVSVGGGREAVEYGPFNHFLFVLDPPLQPEDTTSVAFAMAVGQTSFGTFDPDDALIRDGSFVRLERRLPWLGYRPSLELTEPGTRRAHDLDVDADAGSAPSPDPTVPRSVDVVLTVSTSADQRAAAPGRLIRTWTRGGRRYSRFESTRPGRPRLGIASAGWERVTTGIPGLRIRLLHHRRHAANIPILRDAVRTSLRRFRELYGPLGRRDVTIAEIPSYGSAGVAATSYPGIVYVREHGGYTGDFRGLADGELNYLYRRIAHELAHQWWGDRLDPDRSRPGAAVLTESLAEHSAGLVLEERFGPDARRALLRWNERQYLRWRGRTASEEPGLAGVTAEAGYVARFKGPVVLGALAELMGERSLQDVLRGFLEDLRTRPAGTATFEMLHARLRERVPRRHLGLLESWLHGTGVHDLAIAGVAVRPLTGGRHELRIDVRVDTVASARAHGGPATSSLGPVQLEIRRSAAAVPPVRAGSRRGVEDGGGGALVESRRIHLRPGLQTVRLVVGSRPSRIVLDPRITRLDRDRGNNTWTAPER